MQKPFISIRIIFISLLTLACDNNESNNCVKELTMNIQSESNIPNFYKEIYSDDDYIVSIATFTSPNGDGLNDVFNVLIENLNNNEIFDSSTDNNSTNFLISGGLKISNECEELFTTNNMNSLIWNPGFEPPLKEGTYNVDIDFTLANNNTLDTQETFEVLFTGS